MSDEVNTKLERAEECLCELSCSEELNQEFRHLAKDWYWMFLFGVLLMVCGIFALMFPILTSAVTAAFLGVALMVAGMATIVAAAWAGKWSGMAAQLLVGILYLIVGFMVTDMPIESAVGITLFVAAFCMVIGIFRIVTSLMIRFPGWGWALLNGCVTFLLGLVIYRQYPAGALWMLGVLVGLELLLHGWMWSILALAVRRIPKAAA